MSLNLFVRLLYTALICWCVSMPVKAKTYKIAINKTSYPYHFINDQGQPDGLMVDYWRLWAKEQQVELEFVDSTWAETLTNVASGKVDIHAGLSASDSRAKQLDFTPAFFGQDHYLFTHWSLKSVERIEQLAPYAIGIVANSAHYKILSEEHPYLSLKTFESRHAMYEAAVKGEIKVFASLDIIAGNFNDNDRIKKEFPKLQGLIFHTSRYVGAVAKGETALMKEINQGLARLKYSDIADIERKWLGYAKDKNKLLITYAPDLSPYMQLSSQGEAQGLFIDIWRLWAKYSGQEIEFLPAKMVEGIEALNQEQVDVHAAYPLTDNIPEGITDAFKLYQITSKIYLHQQYANLTQVAQLENKTLGIYQGAPHQEKLEKLGVALNIRTFRDVGAMFLAIQNEEIDGLVMSVDIAREFISVNHWANDYIEFQGVELVTDMHTMVRTENRVLANLISFEYSQIPSNELIALERKWLHYNDEAFYRNKSRKVTLNQEQTAFIANQQDITVGMLSDWFPIEFVDQEGDPQGIHLDYTKLITERTGLKFSFQAYQTWEQLLAAAIVRDVDMVLGMKPMSDREQFFDFSDQYWVMPWAIITLEDRGDLISLDDLKGKRVGIMSGYHLQSFLLENYPSINVIPLDSNDSGMLALKQNNLDALIENVHVASELVKSEKLVGFSIEVLDEIQIETGLIATRNDWPALIEIINIAIATISTEDREKIQSRWLTLDVEEGVDAYVMIRLFTQIGLIVILVIIFIFIWRARFKVELRKRRALEQQIFELQTHDSVSGLPNKAALYSRMAQLLSHHDISDGQIALILIDIDEFKALNQQIGLTAGDEVLALIGHSLSRCLRPSDVLAHLSGDRFAVLLTEVFSKEDVVYMIHKMRSVLEDRIEFQNHHISFQAGIGVALFPTDAQGKESLFASAHDAMFKAKHAGKNQFAFASD